MAVRRWLFFVLMVLLPSPLAAQWQPGPLPEPLGDEAFGVLTQFFAYDAGVPLDVRPAVSCARTRTAGRCAAMEEYEGYTREKLSFTGRNGSRVPAYLALPASGTAPHPVVVVQHGMNGTKDDFWREGHPYAVLTEALLEAGLAVLALDAPYHGERLYENGYSQPPELVLSGKHHRLRDMSVQAVIEHRRALDVLGTRTDVDTTRIGVLGFSQGAMHSLYLGAVEPRVRAAVVWASPMRKAYPLLYPGHFAARVEEAAVLMLAGTDDPFYRVPEVEAVFALIPSEEKQLVVFDGRHQMRPEEIPMVVGWLREQFATAR